MEWMEGRIAMSQEREARKGQGYKDRFLLHRPRIQCIKFHYHWMSCFLGGGYWSMRFDCLLYEGGF